MVFAELYVNEIDDCARVLPGCQGAAVCQQIRRGLLGSKEQ